MMMMWFPAKAFFFHDPVDFQDEGAGHIYVGDVFFFQLIVDGFTYAVRADDYCSILQGVHPGNPGLLLR